MSLRYYWRCSLPLCNFDCSLPLMRGKSDCSLPLCNLDCSFPLISCKPDCTLPVCSSDCMSRWQRRMLHQCKPGCHKLLSIHPLIQCLLKPQVPQYSSWLLKKKENWIDIRTIMKRKIKIAYSKASYMPINVECPVTLCTPAKA